MRRVILDTDILSEIIKRRDPQVLVHATAYASEHGRFTFTSITAQEMVFGFTSKKADKKLATLELLFAKHEIIIPTLPDYLLAGEIRGIARRQGKQIALDDCLIATTAHRLGLPVSTATEITFWR
jgi:tRNA(fMet)-specific endonuclease VapC